MDVSQLISVLSGYFKLVFSYQLYRSLSYSKGLVPLLPLAPD